MSEEFILILISLIFVFILGFLLIWIVFRKIITDKYMKESRKLQLLINNLKKEYGDLVEEPSDFIGSAIGSIGIEGIMHELGIDPSILKNPLVKGFVDKYAPALIQKLGKGGSIDKLQTQTSSQV